MGKLFSKTLLGICLLISIANISLATTYYSQGSTNVNTLTNWNTNRLGGGTSPANFTSGDIFVIQGTGNGGTSPHNMTTSSTWTITGASGKLQIENSAILTATFIIAVPNFQVDNGGHYYHNAASASSNGNPNDIPGTTSRTFGASSDVNIEKWANGGTTPVPLPTISAPGWGNLTINVNILAGHWNQNGTLTAIQGTFFAFHTGGGTNEFRFTGNTDLTATIGGDFYVSNSGQCALVSSSATVEVTVNGNFNVAGGTFALNSGGSGSVFAKLNVLGSVFIYGSPTEFHGSRSGSGDWEINVTGDFNLTGGVFNFVGSSASSKTYTLNIGGDFNQTGGSFGLINSSYGSPNVACVVNFTGGAASSTFTQSGGTFAVVHSSNNRAISFAIKNGKKLTLLNDFKLPPATYATLDSFVVYNGATLNCAANNLTGFGNFMLKPGATLQMGSTNGITIFPTTSGNIQNVGTGAVRSFSKGGNYVYNGAAAQVSGNGIPDSVRSLTINNASGLTLSNPSLTDTVSLVLTNGRIRTDNSHSLKLAATCSVSSVANIYGYTNEGVQSSFISGPLIVERNTTSAGTLPIGKDTSTGVFFAPIRLKPFDNTLKEYTAEYFPTLPPDQTNIDPPLHHISFVEYWHIGCNNGISPSQDAKVTLSWRPQSGVGNGNPLDSVQAKADLAVAHYFHDGTSLKWRMEGTSPTFTLDPNSNMNYGYISTNNYAANFSPFTLGTRSGLDLLPLQLFYFTAKKTAQRTVNIVWRTKEEQDIREYIVERSSDGINFAAISSVVAKNNWTENNYSVIDQSPAAGINYYRIKTRNKQSQFYSAIVKVRPNDLFMTIYPNPATSKIMVQHEKAVKGSIITIFAADGKKLSSVQAAESGVQTSLNIANLLPGLYLLEYRTNGNSIKQKFIKQ